MSKSNNHHCTPDPLGKKKGDSSPFFHIQNKKELRRILLEERFDSTFVTDEELEEFSIFFHKEKQLEFLLRANEARAERGALATETKADIRSLVCALTNLAKSLSTPPEPRAELSKHCARLTDLVSKKEADIRTNILVSIENRIINSERDNTFLQIEKELFFFETATKITGAPSDAREITRQALLQDPPRDLVSSLACALQYYTEAESHLSSQLLHAAKAAKAKNAAKYVNLLHETATRLYDTVRLLNAIGIEKAYV